MSTLPLLSDDGASVLVLVLGALNLLIGLYSIGSAFQYRRYARRSARATGAPPAATKNVPGVTLFVPCCGDEEGLEENLRSLLAQDYPRFHVRFIVESSEDSALPAIERLLAQKPGQGDLLIAGPARGCSQKVHNLLAALAGAQDSEVLVFTDSDGRPEPGWLSCLVQPLDRPEVGVSSSYRFYLPEPSTFPTLLRSAWNASVLTLLGDHDHNFAWGGSMALRRDVFDRISVVEAWQSALSDDYAVTHAVRRAGLKVEFVPQCLVGSRGQVQLLDLLSWTARQIAITRVYWPALFRVAAVTQFLFTTFLVLAPLTGAFGLWAAVLLLAFASGFVRAGAIADLAPSWRSSISRHLWAYALMVPLAGFVTMQGVLRALLSRRIAWRGKVYEMRSPSETVILPHDT